MVSRVLPHHAMGGMQVVAWDLARALVGANVDVTVLTTRIPGHMDAFTEEGVRVLPLNRAQPARYSSAWWSESRRTFESDFRHVDVILSVSAAAYGLLPAMTRAGRPRLVLQAHGTASRDMVSKWRSRHPKELASSLRNLLWVPKDIAAYRAFDAIVAVGDSVFKDLTSPPFDWFVRGDKVKLIRNGIDTTEFRPLAAARTDVRRNLRLEATAPLIVSASRLHRLKGVHHSLRAFSRLRTEFPNAVYVVAGEGPQRPELESIVNELGIASSVVFAGALPRPQLASYLQAADLFLFQTEHAEGLPLNVLEALACGVPVIASDHLGVCNLPQVHGVPPHDTKGVATLAGELLTNRQQPTVSFLPKAYDLETSATQYRALVAGPVSQGDE